jgi:hypothetical protein
VRLEPPKVSTNDFLKRVEERKRWLNMRIHVGDDRRDFNYSHGYLKSHDYHIMMQHVLPLCLCKLMQEEIRMALISLSRVFNKLCAKVVDPQSMQVLKLEALEIMSTIEKVFPPTCFNVMTHLIIHLVEELDLCSPIHTRWMYPIERYVKALKCYVRNMARLEGSMAIGYTIEEALGFCI